MQKLKSGRGGSRKSAGAPRKPESELRTHINVRLPNWLIDRLRESPESQGALIEHALIETYGWSKGDD